MTATITQTTGAPSTRTLLGLAAVGGRADRLRIGLTATGAALATVLLLLALSVALIDVGDGPYQLNVLDEPGLRPGVIISLLLLCVPIVVFLGLCTRVGAPARDRRLSAFRMAGATPAETTRIAAYETGIAAVAGSIVGTAVFLVGRVLLDGTSRGVYTVLQSDGAGTYTEQLVGQVRLFPTDVEVPIAAMVAVWAFVGIGATLSSVLALRRVRVSAFGVTRSVPTKPPTRTAALLFAVGTIGLMGLGVASRTLTSLSPLVIAASLLLFVASVIGLLLGTASLSAAVGRFLAPRVSRPDLLIASRRMIAAPYTASRASASVLLVVLIGSAIQGVRSNFLLSTDPAETFYADTFFLLNCVLGVAVALTTANLLITAAEAIVERRRTLAALVASGTPKSVLARAAMMESLVPLVPAVVVASLAGVFASRAFLGTSVERLVTFEGNGSDEYAKFAVQIPWERIAVLGGGTIAASVAITALSLLLLGRSTSIVEMRAA